MLVIPAIDLSDGQVVRLTQGRMADKTVYSDDPVGVALRWQSEGAQWLHVVDLDAAILGDRDNLKTVARIVDALDIPVELGGGIRSLAAIEKVLGLGVKRVVIGTSALSQPHMVEQAVAVFGEAIAVGIDARDGRVAVKGWTQVSEMRAVELAWQMQQLGVQRLICTDIQTDGMLEGPNVEAMRAFAEAVSIPIIASGGVSRIEDVRALCELARKLESRGGQAGTPVLPVPGSAGVPPASGGIEGCIVGRALYTGDLSLREAIEVARGC
jgi:phosphoribosylformimino-5-aminoimidazole carboxamide ribotide isomerase